MLPLEKFSLILQKLNSNERITPDEVNNLEGIGSMKFLLRDWDNSEGWTQGEQRSFAQMPSFVQSAEFFCAQRNLKFSSLQEDIREATLTSFFTPEPIINGLVNGIQAGSRVNGLEVKTILEPAVGTGKFIPTLARFFPQAQITGIEKNILCAAIAKNSLHELPNVKVFNNVFESLPYNKKYDLIISNIPFANFQIFDSEAPSHVKNHSSSLHGFYFAKSTELLQDNGILCFVTTTGVMDNDTHASLRKLMVQSADLVTAIRLPSHVFQQEGTSVTTDVILLKKNTKKATLSASEKAFISATSKGHTGNVPINTYYNLVPQNVLGTISVGNQYSATSGITVTSESSLIEIGRVLQEITTSQLALQAPVLRHRVTAARRSNNIQQQLSLFDTILEPSPPPVEQFSSEKSDHIISLTPQSGEIIGSIVYRKSNFYQITGVEDRYDNTYFATLVDPEVVLAGKHQDKQKLLALLVDMRNLTHGILEEKTVNQSGEKIRVLQERLSVDYEDITNRVGEPLTLFLKKQSIHDNDIAALSALEIAIDEGKYQRANIFEPFAESSVFHTEDLYEAILHTYNAQCKIDINVVAEILSKPVNDVIKEALNQGYLRYDPSIEGEFCLPYVFRSGHIATKILRYQNMLAGERPSFLSNDILKSYISELEQVRPSFVPLENINPKIGEVFFQVDLYKDFFAFYLDISPKNLRIWQSNSFYKVGLDPFTATYADSKLSVKRLGSEKFLAVDFMEAMLSNRQIYFRYNAGTPEDPLIKPDHMANEKFARLQEDVIEKWSAYVQIPKVKEYIEKTYNAKQAIVPARADGKMLRLDEMERIGLTPRPYQLHGVASIIDRNGGLIDAPTGSGKTMIQLIASYRMKKAGIVQKPLIVGLKANIDEIHQTAKKMYPNAKFLYSDKDSFAAKNRHKFFMQIANNDWDVIFMSHSQFASIPLQEEAQLQVIDEHLANLNDNIAMLKEVEASHLHQHLTKRQLKGLQSKQSTLVAKRTQIMSKADHLAIDIVKMGIDHIMIDEAHLFKNLPFETTHTNVAGLNGKGSDRAAKLEVHLTAIRNTHYNGQDKGFTALTATPLLNNMSEMYVWFKLLNSNDLKLKGLYNFDAWAQTYINITSELELTLNNSYAYRSRCREYLKLDSLMQAYNSIAFVVTPAEVTKETKKPTKQLHHITIKRTEEQKQYLFDLIDFAQEGRRSMIQKNPISDDAGGAAMLLASSYSNMASIDMRLIDPQTYADYAVHENTKINASCVEMKAIYDKENHMKGTQAVFCNQGVPGGKSFNVYKAIKENLVLRGIPSQEIAFIHDHDSDTAREKLMRDVNAGRVRIVIGSTEKLGTGVNMQERLKAIHNLDIPWRPADFEQRTGRAERPGNNYTNVDVFIYSTEQTLDAFRLEVLKHKQHYIDQVRYNSFGQSNTLSEEYGDGNDISYNEMVACVTGNNTIKQYAITQKDYEKTRAAYDSFVSEASIKKAEQYKYKMQLDHATIKRDGFKRAKEVVEQFYYNAPQRDITLTQTGKKISFKDFGEYVERNAKNKTLALLPGSFGTFCERFTIRFVRESLIDPVVIKVDVMDDSGMNICEISYNKGKIADGAQTIAANPIKAVENIQVALDFFEQAVEKNTDAISRVEKDLIQYSPENLTELRERKQTLFDQLSELKEQVQKEKLSVIEEKDRIRFSELIDSDLTFTQASQLKSDENSLIRVPSKISFNIP